MATIVSPSVLSCDFSDIQGAAAMLNKSNADWMHIDIMDGVFVPNISFGLPVMKAFYEHSKIPLDVHLMMQHPEQYIEDFSDAGAETLTVHYEVCTHLHKTLTDIRDCGMKTGVALNPHTPINSLESIIHEVDLVLIMSVNPGFGGQKFIKNSLYKVQALKDLIIRKNTKTLIEVDGGVNLETGQALVSAGADALVAGSFVFGSDEPIETISALKNLTSNE